MASSSSGGTVVFSVGGERYEVLQQTIRAKPETLLCTLLDDPSRPKDSTEPIFVEADKTRFRYILDWYRYGSIKVPCSIGVDEMRRECAFFQLPDGVKISREKPLSLLADVHAHMASCEEVARTRCVDACKRHQEATTEFFAACLYEEVLREFRRDGGYSEVERTLDSLCASNAKLPNICPNEKAVLDQVAAFAEEDGIMFTGKMSDSSLGTKSLTKKRKFVCATSAAGLPGAAWIHATLEWE